MFKEIKYFFTISVLALPIFIISLFIQLRLLGLIECLAIYLFFMGLQTKDLTAVYPFEIKEEVRGVKSAKIDKTNS